MRLAGQHPDDLQGTAVCPGGSPHERVDGEKPSWCRLSLARMVTLRETVNLDLRLHPTTRTSSSKNFPRIFHPACQVSPVQLALVYFILDRGATRNVTLVP